MLIWDGLGVLVPVVTFLLLLAMELSTEAYFMNEHYYQTEAWPMAVGFFVSGLLMFPLSVYLNARPKRIAVDKETGEELDLSQKHSFFFIDIKHWSAVLMVIAVAVYFREL